MTWVGPHIDKAELDLFLQGESSPPVADRIWQHLEECQECRVKLMGTRVTPAGRPKEDGAMCPAPSEWFMVAANLLDPGETEARIEHAATCDHCGPLLRRAIEVINSEISESEAQLLSQLPSSSVQAQERASRVLAGTPARRGWIAYPARWRIPLAGWGIAAACAAILLVVGLQLRQTASDALKLMATSYSEERTSDFRLPGTDFTPVTVQRGPFSRLDNPKFARALAVIAQHASSTDIDWQSARARAHTLEGQPDEALRDLSNLPNTDSRVEMEKAFAYFVRGEEQNSEGSASVVDFGSALDLIERVVQKEPRNLDALYNRALLCERIGAYNKAVQAWEQYLQADSGSGWAAEARRRLAADKERLRRETSYLRSPTLPLYKIAEMARQDPAAARQEIAARTESYLDEATRSWLPAAFDDHAASRAAARLALLVLADELTKIHGDAWLSDLLATASGPDISAAAAALSKAITADAAGDSAAGREQARLAADLFQKSRNEPGRLRAGVEELYAFQRSTMAKQCLAHGRQLSGAVARANYPSIAARFTLQEGICMNMAGYIGQAKTAAERGLQRARDSGYSALALRGKSLVAALEAYAGSIEKAFAMQHEGLVEFSQGAYPPVSGYNFSVNMALLADVSRQWQLKRVLLEEALQILPHGSNPPMEAVAHAEVAKTAMLLGSLQLAEAEFRQSDDLFANSARSQSTENFKAENAVGRAGLAVMVGDVAGARQILRSVEPQLRYAESRFVEFDYYFVFGKAAWMAGRNGEALPALERAAEIAESSLMSLKSATERLQWERRTDELYRLLVQTNLDLGRAESAFYLWEWHRAAALRPVGRAHTGVLHSKAFDAFAHRLQTVDLGDATFLCYAVLPRGLSLWTRNKHGLKWRQFPEAPVLQSAQRYLAAAGDRHFDIAALDALAHTLYGQLIQPVAAGIGPSGGVLIEADAALLSLPFESLRMDDGSYAGDHFRFALMPGLAYLSRLRKAHPLTAEDFALLVGAAASDQTRSRFLPPLNDAREELRFVSRKLRNSVVLEGSNATAENVLKHLPKAAIFDFVGHALSQRGELVLLIAPSSAAPTDRAILNAASFPERSLAQCRLAVLAACSTARSGDDGLADPSSLVRTFLGAGVANVIASRWDVDSAAASEYMQNFYSALQEGRPVAEAAHQASLIVRTRYPHPYYWAAFGTFGRL